jgi:hypothetical protein
MKSYYTILIILQLLLIQSICSQQNYKTGINFPYYIPDLVSIDRYLALLNECGTKSVRQMTFGDVHWKQVEPNDNQWNFNRSDIVGHKFVKI